MSVPEEKYAERMQLLCENDEDSANVFETTWYQDVRSRTPPGDTPKIYRENHGLTQAMLGEMLGGAPRQSISNIERKVKSMALKTALKLANLFNVSLEGIHIDACRTK